MPETTAREAYLSETRVLPLTLIRRDRMLPAAGEILVGPGQRVEASDVVARVELGGQFRTFEIARLLRVPPTQAVRYLKKGKDDAVKAGEIIARRRGFGVRPVRSPVDGMIVDIDERDGRVAIEVASQLFELRAYVKGVVSNMLGRLGVVIETPGALIQAALGMGGESFGVLRSVSESPDEPLRASSFDIRAHGSIVVGGGWITASALEQARQLQLKGMVAGSIEGDSLEAARKMPFPIIVTEGVGRIRMAAPIFELIRAQDGREASINGETQTRWGIVRPEVLIPLPAETRPPLPPAVGAPLTVGARVRVVRGPHVGYVGTVAAISPRAVRIEIGTRVHGAEVRFSLPSQSGGPASTAFVPFANLELLR